MSETDCRDDFYLILGKQIRAVRKAFGMAQADVASAVGISRSSLANIEAGRQGVYAHQLVRMAAVLNVRVGDLVEETSASAAMVKAIDTIRLQTAAENRELHARLNAVRRALNGETND